MIKHLGRVSFKKSLASEIIYKYGYLLYRLFEEAKMFVLLIGVFALP
jgi:hypothetical protein